VTPIAFLDIGFPELCVVAFVGLALYGGRLPEVMRSLGAAYRKLRNSVENLTRETTDVGRDVQRQLPRIYEPQPPKDPAALPKKPAAPAGNAPAADAAPAGGFAPPAADVPGAMPSDEDEAPQV
jgi:Sec-independent protein translocase protein TatA